jgi:glycosyltransferase involved in cell wall biosynthesis
MLLGGLRTKNIIKRSQENMPLITVVTVVRNGEKTLEETILSVINQTYINVEYIIVDGASTDETIDIIRKYEDRIDYWMSEFDNGVYYAMNKGIDLATGEWINFMNSGDRFCTNEILEDIFRVSRNSDVIFGDCIADDKIAKAYIVAGTLEELKKCKPFCHQSMFVKTSIQKKYKFNCKYKICADYDFVKSIFEDKVLFEYVPISISLFACGGISTSGALAYKENALINGLYKKKYWYINYIFFILCVHIKQLVKTFLPKSIIKKYKFSSSKFNPSVKKIWIN